MVDLMRATPEQMLQALALFNWPAGGGQFASPAHEANYRRGMSEAAAILGTAPIPSAPQPAPSFDSLQPAFAQNDSWSCLPTSLRQALHAVGRKPSEAWLENALLDAGIVSVDDGLLDHTGAAVAAFVRDEYEYAADHEGDTVTFDRVMLHAGKKPILIGGRAWGHWSGCRGYDLDHDALMLANPSSGWGGIAQTMSRGDWARLGPWSAVWIEVAGVEEGLALPRPPVTPNPTQDLAALRGVIAELERRVAEESRRKFSLSSAVGYLTGDVKERIGTLLVKSKADQKERDAIVAEMARVGRQYL